MADILPAPDVDLTPLTAGVSRAIDKGSISGAVTLAWHRGRTLDLSALGARDRETGAPMTYDTIFQIASMTKPLTSVLALMLIEKGRFSLQSPVSEWLPELAAPKVLTSADGPLRSIEPAERAITIEDLLTHRSGIGYAFTLGGALAKAYEPLSWAGDSNATADAWLTTLAELPLAVQPGREFLYGHSTDVLGIAIERMLGARFADIMREHLFAPLGMIDTGFDVTPDRTNRAALVYTVDDCDGTLIATGRTAPSAPPPFCRGGDGLSSTAPDMLRFCRMLLDGGTLDGVRLLSPDSVRLITANRLTDAQRAIPFMGMPLWKGQGFGLGVSMITDAAANAWAGPGAEGAYGWPGVLGTWWRVDPVNELILIYMTQMSAPLSGASGSQIATGQRMAAQAALASFQKQAYRLLASA